MYQRFFNGKNVSVFHLQSCELQENVHRKSNPAKKPKKRNNFRVEGNKSKSTNKPMFTKYIYILYIIYIIYIYILYIYMYVTYYIYITCQVDRIPPKNGPKTPFFKVPISAYLGWKGQQIEVAVLTGTTSRKQKLMRESNATP